MKHLKKKKKYDIDNLHLRITDLRLISIKNINSEKIIDIVLKEKIKLYEELKKEAQDSIDKIDYSIESE